MYTGDARVFSTANMTTQDCCDVLLQQVAAELAAGTVFTNTTLTMGAQAVCLGGADTTCAGDIGSPVYCRTSDSHYQHVLVGVVASRFCDVTKPLLMQDLTAGALTAAFT